MKVRFITAAAAATIAVLAVALPATAGKPALGATCTLFPADSFARGEVTLTKDTATVTPSFLYADGSTWTGGQTPYGTFQVPSPLKGMKSVGWNAPDSPTHFTGSATLQDGTVVDLTVACA